LTRTSRPPRQSRRLRQPSPGRKTSSARHARRERLEQHHRLVARDVARRRSNTVSSCAVTSDRRKTWSSDATETSNAAASSTAPTSGKAAGRARTSRARTPPPRAARARRTGSGGRAARPSRVGRVPASARPRAACGAELFLRRSAAPAATMTSVFIAGRARVALRREALRRRASSRRPRTLGRVSKLPVGEPAWAEARPWQRRRKAPEAGS